MARAGRATTSTRAAARRGGDRQGERGLRGRDGGPGAGAACRRGRERPGRRADRGARRAGERDASEARETRRSGSRQGASSRRHAATTAPRRRRPSAEGIPAGSPDRRGARNRSVDASGLGAAGAGDPRRRRPRRGFEHPRRRRARRGCQQRRQGRVDGASTHPLAADDRAADGGVPGDRSRHRVAGRGPGARGRRPARAAARGHRSVADDQRLHRQGGGARAARVPARQRRLPGRRRGDVRARERGVRGGGR